MSFEKMRVPINLTDSDLSSNEDEVSLLKGNRQSIEIDVDIKKSQKNTPELSIRQNIISFKKIIFECVLLLLAILFYIRTLEGCYEPEVICLDKYPISYIQLAFTLIGISGQKEKIIHLTKCDLLKGNQNNSFIA